MKNFISVDFDKLNESDVREEIIAPLIRFLGYRSGTRNNVIREQLLRYPRVPFGLKKPADPKLPDGKVDYILETESNIRWIIEAKAPRVSIDEKAIEQAYSYANHPEVRAVYFALINGQSFEVYQTSRGPGVEPILSVNYEAIDDNLERVKNLLSPEAIIRDHPEVSFDTGNPIGPGLRSVARISNGMINYSASNIDEKVIDEMQTWIISGAVQRNEEDKLIALFDTRGPSQSLQELNERLGMSQFEMASSDTVLSTDSSKPTSFYYQKRVLIPKGESLLNLGTWETHELPMDVSCQVNAQAMGAFEDCKFHGQFNTSIEYLDFDFEIVLSGEFFVYLV